MKRSAILLTGTALATGTVAAAEIAASYTFMLGTKLLTFDRHANAVYHYDSPLTAWWDYLGYPGVQRWTGIGAIAGGVVLAFAAFIAYRIASRRRKLVRPFFGGTPAIERGVTDIHGHADWMALNDLRRMFPGPDPVYGGVVVGEAYRVDQDSVASMRFDPKDRRTWGRGGTAPLLIDRLDWGSGQVLSIAGSGGYKTTTIMSTMLHWRGSLICHDPATEIGPMAAAAREGMGHTVIQWSLKTPGSGTNPLAHINPDDPLAEEEILALTDMVCGDAPRDESGSGGTFDGAGRSMIAALIAHVVWSDNFPAEQKTLSVAITPVTQPPDALRAALRGIGANSKSPLARRLAAPLADLPDVTFGGVVFNAAKQTKWLLLSANERFLSDNAFCPADLAGGNLSVFVQIPVSTLKTCPGLARVALWTLMYAVFKADGAVRGRVFAEIDEALHCGAMAIFDRVRVDGRKYRLHQRLWYQSKADIAKVWGRDAVGGWLDGANYVSYSAVQDQETAELISKRSGTFGAMSYSETENSGRSGGIAGQRNTGTGSSKHEVKRNLITPDEVQTMRDDEQIIIPRSGKVARCGRAIYFRRPEMASALSDNRFFRRTA